MKKRNVLLTTAMMAAMLAAGGQAVMAEDGGLTIQIIPMSTASDYWNALRKGAEGKWEERPLTGIPFSHSGAPCAIYLPGKLVPQWKLQDGNTSDLPAERNFEGAEQMVRLIPYGCTKLRISEFPWYEEEQKQQEERI